MEFLITRLKIMQRLWLVVHPLFAVLVSVWRLLIPLGAYRDGDCSGGADFAEYQKH